MTGSLHAITVVEKKNALVLNFHLSRMHIAWNGITGFQILYYITLRMELYFLFFVDDTIQPEPPHGRLWIGFSERWVLSTGGSERETRFSSAIVIAARTHQAQIHLDARLHFPLKLRTHSMNSVDRVVYSPFCTGHSVCLMAVSKVIFEIVWKWQKWIPNFRITEHIFEWRIPTGTATKLNVRTCTDTSCRRRAHPVDQTPMVPRCQFKDQFNKYFSIDCEHCVVAWTCSVHTEHTTFHQKTLENDGMNDRT